MQCKYIDATCAVWVAEVGRYGIDMPRHNHPGYDALLLIFTARGATCLLMRLHQGRRHGLRGRALLKHRLRSHLSAGFDSFHGLKFTSEYDRLDVHSLRRLELGNVRFKSASG
jgi:hypothetical protein